MIDIDKLNERELIDLNHRIVARLRMLRELKAHTSMLTFRIGERVVFHPEGQAPVAGVITRYNKKTVSILTEDGQRWTVAPQLLRRTVGKYRTVEPADCDAQNVIPLPLPDQSRK
jgi:hypothetical protein